MSVNPGTSNQQSNPGEEHPLIEEVIFHSSGPSIDHYVDMPLSVDSGKLLIALCASDNDSDITAPTGWVDHLHSTSIDEMFMAIFTRLSDGTEGGTSVNFQGEASRKFACQVFMITQWSGDLANIDSDDTDLTFSPPAVNAWWGTFATLWICSVHSSMTRVYLSHPAEYSDFLEVKTGMTTTDAQVYSCRVLNQVDTMSSGSWIFEAGSGHWYAVQVAIKGATVV